MMDFEKLNEVINEYSVPFSFLTILLFFIVLQIVLYYKNKRDDYKWKKNGGRMVK